MIVVFDMQLNLVSFRFCLRRFCVCVCVYKRTHYLNNLFRISELVLFCSVLNGSHPDE